MPAGQGGYPRFLARLNGLGALGVDLGLDRVRRALSVLGSPERAIPAVQIAGTNGKGSTAAMTESILRCAGLATGLFTSPHLARFTERIRIRNREVDGERLADLDAAVVATGVPLTYFEVSAVLAFLCMAEDGVDVGVFETGLGGRLDAATVCAAVTTAITGISDDHRDVLGPTLRDIAREKAGIARSGVPLLLAPMSMSDDVEDEIRRAAARAGAPLFVADPGALIPAGASIGLGGAHQRINAALAVALARDACRHLGRSLPESAVRDGLRAVQWPARLERIEAGGDATLLDCAHNAEAAQTLAAALASTAVRPRALVVSVVHGKDAATILRILAPAVDFVIATRSRSERAMPAEMLAAMAPGALVVPDPLVALSEARRRVGVAGLVVVAGSIFLAGQVRAALLGEPIDPVATSDPPTRGGPFAVLRGRT